MANWTRIKHDANGNPLHVTSWCGYGFTCYADAIRAANKLGGRKYHNRSFGGGLVFQAYEGEIEGIEQRLKYLASV